LLIAKQRPVCIPEVLLVGKKGDQNFDEVSVADAICLQQHVGLAPQVTVTTRPLMALGLQF